MGKYNWCGNLTSGSFATVGIGTESAIIARFGDKMLPLKYKHKEGTFIFIDDSGNPVGIDNGDGTWSGIDATKIFKHETKI